MSDEFEDLKQHIMTYSRQIAGEVIKSVTTAAAETGESENLITAYLAMVEAARIIEANALGNLINNGYFDEATANHIFKQASDSLRTNVATFLNTVERGDAEKLFDFTSGQNDDNG